MARQVGIDEALAEVLPQDKVTLVKGDLRGIARATSPSQATMRNIRQNLVFAFGDNALGIPMAAGALYPAFGLSPIARRIFETLGRVA